MNQFFRVFDAPRVTRLFNVASSRSFVIDSLVARVRIVVPALATGKEDAMTDRRSRVSGGTVHVVCAACCSLAVLVVDVDNEPIRDIFTALRGGSCRRTGT